MTIGAIIVMSVSVFSILALFTFCMYKVMTAPMEPDHDADSN